jgi:hypothetical protein
MTSKLYMWCALIGLLGIIFQTLIKLSMLKKQSTLANHPFKAADYFKDDWITILLNIITLAVAIIAMDELVKYQPKVLPFIKWFFFFIGYTGSSLLNFFLSKTQNTINKIIDVKSNIADDKVSVNENQ